MWFFCRTQTSNWYQHRYQNSRALWYLSHKVSIFLQILSSTWLFPHVISQLETRQPDKPSAVCQAAFTSVSFSQLDDGNVCLYLRYFMVLIQEMDLKLDLGFLYAILDLLTPENASIMTSEQEVWYTPLENFWYFATIIWTPFSVYLYSSSSSRWNCLRRTWSIWRQNWPMPQLLTRLPSACMNTSTFPPSRFVQNTVATFCVAQHRNLLARRSTMSRFRGEFNPWNDGSESCFICFGLVAAASEFLPELRRRRRPERAERDGAHSRPVAQPAAEEHRRHSHWCAGRCLQVWTHAASESNAAARCYSRRTCWWRNLGHLTDSHLFQVGLLWVDLPVLYHSTATVGGHQTLFQAGDTSHSKSSILMPWEVVFLPLWA